MSAKVGIIILSWNGKDNTLECLETVAGQTYTDYFTLVVDNGSTDNLASLLEKKYPKTHYVHLEENQGFAGGSNVGLREAARLGAEYVLTPNNDTLLDKQCLEHLVRAAEQHPHAAGWSPKIYFTEPDDVIYFGGGRFSPVLFIPEHIHQGRKDNGMGQTVAPMGFITACSPLYRLKSVLDIGGYDEQFKTYYEDADLSLRLQQAGHALLFVPQAKVWHKHSSDITRNTLGNQLGDTSAYKWYHMTRNRLWLIRKHLRGIRKAYVLAATVCYRITIILALTLRRRKEKARAVWKGLREGLGQAHW